MNPLISYLIWPVFAYLAGSFPFGLFIVRWASGYDVRRTGSGNIGATNVRRIAGDGPALATLVCDMLKGMLPTLGAVILPETGGHALPALTALAAILGHMYPVYLKCRPSGKGVATAMGAFLILTPLAVAVAVLVFILGAYKFRRISAASLIATMSLPPAIWFSLHSVSLTVCGLVAMILIIDRHEDNLRRLASGAEPPFAGKRE